MIEAARRMSRFAGIDWEMVALWITVVIECLAIIWLGGAAAYWTWILFS